MKVQLPINAATASLKDTPLVVSEENDVSRQVVKPIYLEDLDNDGFLTFNQRTSESCGAVQAGHTVSAVEDNTPNISESILSSPSEILISNINNNLIPTYPDDELLPDETETTSTDSNTTPLVEETSTNLYSDISKIHDPLACYSQPSINA